MKDDAPDWAPAIGAGLAIAIFITIALVAAGGWDWFSRFLEGSAASWVGGLGSAAAAIVALYLAGRHERLQQKAARDIALMFKISLLDGIRAARFAAALGSFEAVGRARADLEQALAIGHSVPMANLETQQLLSVGMLRSLNAQCLHTISTFLQVGDKNAFPELESHFIRYRVHYYKRQGLTDEEIPEI